MTEIFNQFKGCLDILRGDGASLTGEDAFGELARFFIMALIEPHVESNVIDMHFDDRSFYEKDGRSPYTDEQWNSYIKYTKFSNLVKFSSTNLT